MTLYKIANWECLFETYETKKLAHLKWVPVPNKHDGLGFRRVASQKNRCELFAAWNLILQVASKGKKTSERGMLQRDGKPLAPSDLAIMTGFPASIFETAIEFFSSPEMGWLVVGGQPDTDKTAEPPVKTADSRKETCPHPAEGKEGMEGKGKTEQEVFDFSDIIPERLRTDEFLEAWGEWVAERKGKRNAITRRAAKGQLQMLEKLGPELAVRSINESICNGWQGLFEPRGVKAFPARRTNPKRDDSAHIDRNHVEAPL